MQNEKWNQLIALLESMHEQMKMFNNVSTSTVSDPIPTEAVYLPFKGVEIYLLLKALVDAGGTPHENYKSILEKVIPWIINKTHKRFSPQSLAKYSDKVDFETKDTVKRFLQKMIRNIDSYD